MVYQFNQDIKQNACNISETRIQHWCFSWVLQTFSWYLFCRVPLNIWFLSLDPLLVFDRSALQYSSLKRIINISLKKQLLIKFLEKCIRRKFLFSETARCMTTVCNFALNNVVLMPHRDIVAQMWYRAL